eukprot:224610-Amphidinium_carterae.1
MVYTSGRQFQFPSEKERPHDTQSKGIQRTPFHQGFLCHIQERQLFQRKGGSLMRGANPSGEAPLSITECCGERVIPLMYLAVFLLGAIEMIIAVLYPAAFINEVIPAMLSGVSGNTG